MICGSKVFQRLSIMSLDGGAEEGTIIRIVCKTTRNSCCSSSHIADSISITTLDISSVFFDQLVDFQSTLLAELTNHMNTMMINPDSSKLFLVCNKKHGLAN